MQKAKEEITEFEKSIYNIFLKVSRTSQNQPYRYRKDFTDFENTENYHYVRKLRAFFSKFETVKIEDFFRAPYSIYPDQASTFDLHFYITPKAIKVYSLYNKKIDEQGIESHESSIKQSLFFIYKFCKDNRLLLKDYLNHKTNDVHTFILHLKSKDVSLYVLLSMNNFSTILSEYGTDMLGFIFGDEFVEKKLDMFRTRLYNSTKIMSITKRGLEKIETLINQINKPK